MSYNTHALMAGWDEEDGPSLFWINGQGERFTTNFPKPFNVGVTGDLMSHSKCCINPKIRMMFNSDVFVNRFLKALILTLCLVYACL